jgi:hypothetical protein
MSVTDTAGVVFTTLRILGAVLYIALALAFRTGRVFSRPLRWFLLAEGLAVLTFSSDPLQAEILRSTHPWIYALFLLPVLALFPLLYLGVRATGRITGTAERTIEPRWVLSRGIEPVLVIAGALALVALIVGALAPGSAEWLFPGPGAPLATALLWNMWHLCFLVSAFLFTVRKAARKREDLEQRLLRLLVWYAIFVFAVSGTLELALPRLDMPVVSLLLVLLPYGFIILLLARAPALLQLARSRYAGSDLDAAAAAKLADKARALLQSEKLWADPGLTLQNLAESDRKVADVAFEVGFNSLSSFNAAFKERIGLTPSAWRKKLTDS